MVLQVKTEVTFGKDRGIGEWKEFQKELLGSCNVRFFNLHGGKIDVSTLQNSLSCTLMISAFL